MDTKFDLYLFRTIAFHWGITINATHVSNVWLHLRWKLDTTGQRYMVCSYFTRRRFMYHAVWYKCDKIQSTNIFHTERCFFPTTTSVHRTRSVLLHPKCVSVVMVWNEVKRERKKDYYWRLQIGWKVVKCYKMAKNPPPGKHEIPP